MNFFYGRNFHNGSFTLIFHGAAFGIIFFFFPNYFYQLEANYFIVLQWFLPYIDMDQPWIYMYSPSRSPPPASLPTLSLWVFAVHQPKHLSHASNLYHLYKFLPCLLFKVFLESESQSFSHVQLFVTPWTVAHQVPLFMEFSKQEYWSGLPFPSSGDLPDPGIKPRSPALPAASLLTKCSGKTLGSLLIKRSPPPTHPQGYSTRSRSISCFLSENQQEVALREYIQKQDTCVWRRGERSVHSLGFPQNRAVQVWQAVTYLCLCETLQKLEEFLPPSSFLSPFWCYPNVQ